MYIALAWHKNAWKTVRCEVGSKPKKAIFPTRQFIPRMETINPLSKKSVILSQNSSHQPTKHASGSQEKLQTFQILSRKMYLFGKYHAAGHRMYMINFKIERALTNKNEKKPPPVLGLNCIRLFPWCILVYTS